MLLCLLTLLSDIKEFVRLRGKDISLLEDTDLTLDLAFLMDISGKLNSLYCKLPGKGKTVADIKIALNAFKANKNIFSVHLQRKKKLHFLLCGWG